MKCANSNFAKFHNCEIYFSQKFLSFFVVLKATELLRAETEKKLLWLPWRKFEKLSNQELNLNKQAKYETGKE